MATPEPEKSLDQLLAEVEQQLSQKPTPPNPPEQDPLAALAAEFAQKRAQPERDPFADLAAGFAQKQAQPPQDATEDALASLASQFQQPKQAPAPSPGTDDLITQLQQQFKPTPPKAPPLDDRLNQLQQNLKPQPVDPAAQLRAQEEQLRAQRGRELERQQRRKAIAPKAEAWLKALDPYSDEGLWFEQFAYNYASRLEAAIDYLEALL
ncbi:hypothetical protein VB712_12840 [Spirulina sp. CCNP1310]|uniref:salt stress protein, Slr1339 family n=1 Tax=Spirulina sp. CCNP1310 TaxID=3110249 RepID=UPI002B1F11D8|nr:hypothetical protein [Spirulina sp. CCNP1310]MEA5420110.1 hypothetical protein [Spirulina sp. CCNP1310]